MKQGQVVVTATTLYNDPLGKDRVRFELICELVVLARQAGHEVVIVDSSPELTVGHELKNLGAIVIPAPKNMSMGAKRRLVWESSQRLFPEAEAFLWTEEKPDIIRSIPAMLKRMRETEAVVVMPCRSKKSWETYPEYQRTSEQTANVVYNFCFLRLGAMYDPMFGPLLILAQTLSSFYSFMPGEWGLPDTYVQHYPPPLLSAIGENVESIEVDFEYPSAQKAEEETTKSVEMAEKRLNQLCSLIRSYLTIRDMLNKEAALRS